MMPGTLVISDTLNQLPSYLRKRSRMVVGEEGGSSPAPAFSPLDNAKLSEWWNVLSLMEEGPGPVDSWTGLKGVFTLNASTTERPTLVTNDGDGKPALQFDGVDDLLGTVVSRDVMFSATAGEQWFVMKPRNTGIQGFGGYGNATGNYWILFTSGETLYMDAPDHLANRAIVAVPEEWLDGWHVVRLVWDGTNRQIWVDGVQLLTVTQTEMTIPNTAETFRVGQASGAAYGMAAFRHVLTFTAVLTTEEAVALTTYLGDWT